MATRYLGAAGIDELLHIAFRVPDSAPVAGLRDEIISLPLCHTDQNLFNVAAAASYNGKAAWLAAAAAADQASPLVWRQRRGALLAGFGVLRVPSACPVPADKSIIVKMSSSAGSGVPGAHAPA